MSTKLESHDPTLQEGGDASISQAFDIEVYYDGDCPLCMREVRMLRRRDRKKRISFVDIAASGFNAALVGRTQDALMARIHGRLRDGTLIEGVEVFRRLYSAVGFGFLVALTRLPGIAQLLDVAYRLFAANRLRLTGRCSAGACSMNAKRATVPEGATLDARPSRNKLSGIGTNQQTGMRAQLSLFTKASNVRA